ncbi:SRR1-domain-containing protein [Neolentinus lepideus HHB14362 ss-1]|uniref:SRR1-domain-containing protein n=1 Tax=Neolentinus lepideus HHB14362 ss-1 TaxID=1314782 RepID=A0A165TDA4_9AGAM|nr:SRR1-domain-containing protein [Neolentinus lepideus HHB14362 ss-1]
MSSTVEYGSFQYVQSSSRRKRKGKTTQQHRPAERLLQQCLQELRDGNWVRECKQLVRDAFSQVGWTRIESVQILCLGLGSPSSSQNAAAQLAFLLDLCDDLSIPYARISTYDPVFSEQDIGLLNGLQIRSLTENLNGKHEIDAPTIVFMPHCDVKLYETILAANWTKKSLRNVLFICNQFGQYEITIPQRTFKTEYPRLLRYKSHSESILLPECDTHRNAFISVAVQFISSQRLCFLTQDTEFWNASPPDEHSPREAS